METKSGINNAFYDELGDRWLHAQDDPVALLRAETLLKNPWILQRIQRHFPNLGGLSMLDVGCGAGFLSNPMAESGLQVTGLDASESSLEVARSWDKTKKVQYTKGDAYALPFENAQFDIVCAMDFLEHVEEPRKVVGEAARVLKPGGFFFFHTFNRCFLANLLVIKMVEWLVPNTPPHMHVIDLFIKPKELAEMCVSQGLIPQEWTGIRPQLFKWSVVKGVLNRKVPKDFSFTFTRSQKVSYMGYAIKT